MTLQHALDALKRNDFSAARRLVSSETRELYTHHHYLILGLADLALKEWPVARDTFQEAVTVFPDYARFWFNKGIAEENMNLVGEAVASQEKTIGLDPQHADAFGNLSNLYRKQKRFRMAEDMARRVLALRPHDGQALNSLGLALARQGAYDEAASCYQAAHAAAPSEASILLNHANLEIDALHFEKAWPLFEASRALDDQPICRHDEGLARLLAGDYQRGWNLYEARLDLPRALRLSPSCARWHGEPLEGKNLLIVAEQGYGDVIQFCRYQSYLKDGSLTWAVPRPLVKLLSGTLRGDVIDEAAKIPVCDFYVPIMSLPLLTKQFAPAGSRVRFQPSLTPALPRSNNKKAVLLVLKGSPTHERDHERSLSLELFAPLLMAEKVNFYAADIGGATLATHSALIPLHPLIHDFADTAALLKQMDCVITVDTAMAHLAGSLNIETFLLLPYCPDWRWGAWGERTAWYPSVTLLRQTQPGNWADVVKRIWFSLRVGTD